MMQVKTTTHGRKIKCALVHKEQYRGDGKLRKAGFKIQSCIPYSVHIGETEAGHVLLYVWAHVVEVGLRRRTVSADTREGEGDGAITGERISIRSELP
jgi:hypothetical protein